MNQKDAAVDPAARHARIIELKAKGLTTTQIAARLGMSVKQVSRIVKAAK
jgi:DNA-binding CsgD family transcriptional regulator